MAKVKNKTSYLRGLVSRQISRMEKRGYQVPSEIKENIKTAKYQTLKSLRDRNYGKLYEKSTYTQDGQTVSGRKGRLLERKRATEKAKRTVKEKKYRESFKDIEGQFDPETGEIFDSYYQSQGKQQGQGPMPQDDPVDNILTVLDEFIDRLSQPIPDYFYDRSGQRRYYSNAAKEQIERSTNYLKNLVEREIARGNAVQLAQRLEENADIISQAIEELYSYYEDVINRGMMQLANIISSHVLSMSDLTGLSAAQDYSSGYEDY